MKTLLLKFSDRMLSDLELRSIRGGDSCSTVCRNGDVRGVNCPLPQRCHASADGAWCDDITIVDLCEY